MDAPLAPASAAAHTSPIWHPFTQHALADPPLLIDRAEGAALITADGRRILDGISSWWVNTHGHAHPKIAAAVAAQAARLEQVIFAGFTHGPAEALAEKLIARAPTGLTRVFFSDSGSTAVEVAIKMAVGTWRHRGEERYRIAALEDAYHGDTFGTMAGGQRGLFSQPYDPMLFAVDRLPFPEAGREGRTVEAFASLLRDKGREIAALILEPLVLGAGGMRIYAPSVLAELAALCRRSGVLLILDEVMTGFGRTGTFFACEQAAVAPDLLCLSKGLTGGFLPMGVTLATDHIFSAFYAPDRARMFFHSTSFTGNPLACAAALASLGIWEEEPVFERIRAITRFHEEALERLRRRTDVAHVRQAGTIAAFDVIAPDAGYLAAVRDRLYRFFLAHDVLLRPLGNVVYILPPYCISAAELERIYDVIAAGLDALRS